MVLYYCVLLEHVAAQWRNLASTASPVAYQVVRVSIKIQFVASSLTEHILVRTVGTFSCIKIDERNARERELFDRIIRCKSASSGNAEPYER